jgi:cytochrome bd-type quinol oxidase subunit 1
MVLMVGLLSILFITALVYLYDRKEKILKSPGNEKLHRLFRVFIVIAAIAGIILVQPYTLAFGVNPLGFMSYKLVALFVLIAIGAFAFGIDLIMLREPGMVEWGALSDTSRSSGILAGVLGLSIVLVMGYVRESARSPWTIYKIIPVPGGQSYPTPIPAYQIFVVWGVIIAMVMAIFWFTSRVTAEHPEEAEEV